MSQFENIAIVGLGNMAGAMLDGWLASGLNPERFTAIDPARENGPGGVTLLRELPKEGEFDCIVLGVKPQLLREVAGEVERLAGPQTTIVSILAGTANETLRGHFPRAKAILRVMPNLAASLRKSATTMFAENLDDAIVEKSGDLMARLGSAEWLQSEDQFHAVTALAGSGPGFVYRFIETLAQAAQTIGIPREQAERLAKQMVAGASALAADSDLSAAELARRVASPGGVTQEGLDVLDRDERLQQLITECLQSAYDRSVEMAEISGKDS